MVNSKAKVKPVGCKSMYRRKKGPDGKVETFKERLVEKGFNSKTT